MAFSSRCIMQPPALAVIDCTAVNAIASVVNTPSTSALVRVWLHRAMRSGCMTAALQAAGCTALAWQGEAVNFRGEAQVSYVCEIVWQLVVGRVVAVHQLLGQLLQTVATPGVFSPCACRCASDGPASQHQTLLAYWFPTMLCMRLDRCMPC